MGEGEAGKKGVNPFERFVDEEERGKEVKEPHDERGYDEKALNFFEGLYQSRESGMSWRLVKESIEAYDYSPKEVEAFSYWLEEKQRRKDPHYTQGKFLRMLIRNMKGEEVVLCTKGYREPLDYLGGNIGGKKVVVDGDAGDLLGHWLEGGDIIVSGSAGKGVGQGMKSGQVTVNGSVEDAGRQMNGGRIEVKANAARVASEEFWFDGILDGEIVVHGGVGEAGKNMRGGKVVLKGGVKKLYAEEMLGGEIWLEQFPDGWTGEYRKCTKGGKVYCKGKLIMGKKTE